jgi:hypothetical protein
VTGSHLGYRGYDSLVCIGKQNLSQLLKYHQMAAVRSHPFRIPDVWPLRPRYSRWLLQRHGPVLWVLAYFVYHRVQYPTTPTLQDFADFMRRGRWKAHPLPQRSKRDGDYLTVLVTSPPPSICPWVLRHSRVPVAEKKIPPTTHNENLPIISLVFCVSHRTQMYAGRYTTSHSTMGHIVLCTKLTCISSCHK